VTFQPRPAVSVTEKSDMVAVVGEAAPVRATAEKSETVTAVLRL